VIGVTPRHNIRQEDQVIAVKQRTDLSRRLDALTDPGGVMAATLLRHER
jgi:hypothetical protein